MKLIDADALNDEMYHKSFETDDGRQKWNSGLWIRYKIFEEAIKDAPTIEAIPIDWICSWWGKQGVPSLSHCLENTDEVIRTMLMDWEIEEKQNERL